MNILVTGGAGFIGSHLCGRLVQANHRVTAVDDLSLGRISNIAHILKNRNFRFVKADILETNTMRRLFSNSRFDTVFHLAANSDISAGVENPDIDFRATFLSTYNILNLMSSFRVKNIIFPSSSAVYGENERALSEDTGPLFPISSYGAAKLASEAFISSFCEAKDMKAWIIRFPNVIGGHATHGILFDFLKKLKKNPRKLTVLGNGKQNKPYLYVDELVDAVLYIWKHSHDRINCFNVGSRGRTKVSDIAEMVIKEYGSKTKIHYTGGPRGWKGDVPKFNYDTSKLKTLGWEPRITSTQAVRKAIRTMLK